MTNNEAPPDMKFEIKNVQPIELVDLTNSLLALGNEYQSFLRRQHPEADASEVKLYINEVRSGSVIALLTAVSPQLIDGFNYVNTVVDFATFLKSAFALTSKKPDFLCSFALLTTSELTMQKALLIQDQQSFLVLNY